MAYTIVKSDGGLLTNIPDGTIDTTSTTLALPGRNYAGYGQALNTNFVHMVENFADDAAPANPLRGQLWYGTSTNSLQVYDGATWLTLTTTASGGTTSFGEVTVTGNVTANNFVAINDFTGNSLSVSYATVSANATIENATIGNLTVTGTGNIRVITTGSATTTGSITGVWTLNGTSGGAGASSLLLNTGGLYINPTYGIKTDNYMWANGNPVSFSGSYDDANVAVYLPTYTGIVGSVSGSGNATFRGNLLTTGSSSNTGTITGTWTLSTNSRLNATYADLAERFEADVEYDAGTVVEIGGIKEITAVKDELSENVFGVVSSTAAYLMNAAAGDDITHPAIAVSGRVNVKVRGQVKKGDRLVSAGNGTARAAKKGEANAFNTIGRSLGEKSTEGLGTVEAIVIIR